MPFRGEEVLYVVGTGIVDTSCCGTGGCRYAIVPGFILDWRVRTNKNERPVTAVEPIRDADTRKELKEHITKAEMVQLVEFH